MRTAIIFLDYSRHEYTQRVLANNLSNAGCHYDMYMIDQLGLAAAFNKGLKRAKHGGYTGYVFMANDIIMPDGWLSTMQRYHEAVQNTGIIGIHTVEALPSPVQRDGMTIHECMTPFGNQYITDELFQTIGYYNQDFDPYGMQDNDYGYRAVKSGFVNYYLPDMQSHHLGHDAGNGTDYRRMKDEGLHASPAKWHHWVNKYDSEADYTIFYPDYDF